MFYGDTMLQAAARICSAPAYDQHGQGNDLISRELLAQHLPHESSCEDHLGLTSDTRDAPRPFRLVK